MIEVVGAVGCLFFLFAFYRTSIGKWTGRSLWYELDNVIGATLLAYYSVHKQAYINIFLNVIWLLVAARGLSSIIDRINRQKRLKSKKNSKKLKSLKLKTGT